MFDTVYLKQPYVCSNCGQKVGSVQTKAFDQTLDEFRIGDCISHAEDIRIVKEELYCQSCQKLPAGYVYLVVNRGILTGIARKLDEAWTVLPELNLEQMILWYHDLFGRYKAERDELRRYRNFLNCLCRYFKSTDTETKASISLTLGTLFTPAGIRSAAGPLEAIEQFIINEKIRETLADLWEEGYDPLAVSYEGDVRPGQNHWSVVVNQAEINRRCALDKTWTVKSKGLLCLDGIDVKALPERVLVIDGPFSEKELLRVVKAQVQTAEHPFEVVISADRIK